MTMRHLLLHSDWRCVESLHEGATFSARWLLSSAVPYWAGAPPQKTLLQRTHLRRCGGVRIGGAAGYGATREAARMAQRQKALERKLAALQPALAQHKQAQARMQALTALQLQRGAFTKLLSALAGAAMPEVQLAELNYE